MQRRSPTRPKCRASPRFATRQRDHRQRRSAATQTAAIGQVVRDEIAIPFWLAGSIGSRLVCRKVRRRRLAMKWLKSMGLHRRHLLADASLPCPLGCLVLPMTEHMTTGESFSVAVVVCLSKAIPRCMTVYPVGRRAKTGKMDNLFPSTPHRKSQPSWGHLTPPAGCLLSSSGGASPSRHWSV